MGLGTAWAPASSAVALHGTAAAARPLLGHAAVVVRGSSMRLGPAAAAVALHGLLLPHGRF